MKPNIDFVECLKDSPRFRASLEEAETDVELLETKLEKLLKLCNAMIEAGKVFSNANSAFVMGVQDVADYFHVRDEDIISGVLERCVHTLNELQKYQHILLDQAHRSICKNLNTFIKSDIKKVKETKRHFEKISDDMDAALVKNAQAPRSRPQDCEDAINVLTAMRSCFGHTSLDYVYQLNILHSKKRFDVLDTMLAYMHAQNAFFHQGSDLFSDLDPYLKQVAAQIEELNSKAASKQKEMEERHTMVQQRELELSTPATPQNEKESEICMEGYLFKRTSNAFKSWVRRWFMIQNNQLVYRKRSKDSLTVMEEDLRLCTVRPLLDIDRRFCFEVLSPARSHVLQADSEKECQGWINAIQAGVSQAYRDAQNVGQDDKPEPVVSRSTLETQSLKLEAQPSLRPSQRRMEQILQVPGNDKCCDCGSPDPRWASINLGITLCIECSGIHRSLGVHLSKVRSVTLDAWEPEVLKVMLDLGNSAVNSVFQAKVDESIAKPASPVCPREVREAWIKAKYCQHAFTGRLVQQGTAQEVEGSDTSAKRWSVQKRRRRSPSKADTEEQEGLCSETSQDSGLVGDQNIPEVVVFGAEINNPAEVQRRSIENLSGSEDSEAEAEGEDGDSTTSCEDLSCLCPDMLLYKAAAARNLPVMLKALAQGADVNWSNPEHSQVTPLIKAVHSGSMAPVEFLLLNGAKVNKKDGKGQTPLHHAVMLGHTGQVCQFLKRRANQRAVDEDGNDPLSIAVENANADIVTLLRLAKLNEEMKETEGIYAGPGDETFNEVFRDFTQMANHQPERLNRYRSSKHALESKQGPESVQGPESKQATEVGHTTENKQATESMQGPKSKQATEVRHTTENKQGPESKQGPQSKQGPKNKQGPNTDT